MTSHRWGLSLQGGSFNIRHSLRVSAGVNSDSHSYTQPPAHHPPRGAPSPCTCSPQYTCVPSQNTRHPPFTLSNTHTDGHPATSDIQPHTPRLNWSQVLFPRAQLYTLLFPALKATSSSDWWRPPGSVNQKKEPKKLKLVKCNRLLGRSVGFEIILGSD